MWLAKDGIFPIVKDSQGHPLSEQPASGLSIPGTIQGEGKLNGIPSLFIRLAGCNLRCCWKLEDGSLSPCDTLYASYQLQQAFSLSVEEIYQIIRHNSRQTDHLVITGGEPFLQADELKVLCRRLKRKHDYHLTIETNATLFDPEVATFIDLFSLSPKLSASHAGNLSAENYLKPDCIQAFIHYARQQGKDFQLKFVHATSEDIQEIEDLLTVLKGWKKEDILLMPVGGTTEMQLKQRQQTLECCIQHGWRYCERLHISLFGNQAGV